MLSWGLLLSLTDTHSCRSQSQVNSPCSDEKHSNTTNTVVGKWMVDGVAVAGLLNWIQPPVFPYHHFHGESSHQCSLRVYSAYFFADRDELSLFLSSARSKLNGRIKFNSFPPTTFSSVYRFKLTFMLIISLLPSIWLMLPFLSF